MSLIYLASPYSHDDHNVREMRFLSACAAAASLMRQGKHVYSPIAHTHPIAKFGLPLDWSFWGEYDRKFLAVCESMIVLMLDGWDKSKGVSAEMQIAKDMNIPITFMEPT